MQLFSQRHPIHFPFYYALACTALSACSAQPSPKVALKTELPCVEGISIPAPGGLKKGLQVGQILDSIPFGGSNELRVESKWDLNRDGRSEYALYDGMHIDYGQGGAIISPCGDSNYVVIAGPNITHGFHPLSDSQAFISEAKKYTPANPQGSVEYMLPGWKALAAFPWKTWEPLFEWQTPRISWEEPDACEDIHLMRRDFHAGRYQMRYATTCSCHTFECDSVRTVPFQTP